MSEGQLNRVRERIGYAIVSFFKYARGREFHADELRSYVYQTVGPIAPGSPDRVMRDLRQRGEIDYRLVDRARSLYLIL